MQIERHDCARCQSNGVVILARAFFARARARVASTTTATTMQPRRVIGLEQRARAR